LLIPLLCVIRSAEAGENDSGRWDNEELMALGKKITAAKKMG